jgi:hypothetical protein
MTRTIVFLMTLMVVLPSDGSAQDVPSPGDRIRIMQVDGAIFTGTLVGVSDEVIQLSVDSSRVVERTTFPRSGIATLERQEGTSDKRNLGGVVGLLAGGAIAWATLGDHEDRCDQPFLSTRQFACLGAADINNTTDDVLRVFLGVAIGGVVGALIGSAIRTENWVIVPLIEVAPSGQSTSAPGFSFGVRVARVGLPW